MSVAPEAEADELASGGDGGAGRRTGPSWLWRGGAGTALVVAAALFGPGLLASSDDPVPSPNRAPSLPPLRPETIEPPTPRPAAPLDWSVRGDLAEDTPFLAAALARVKQQEVAAAKVLYAATLPDGGRLALVALARSDPVSDLGRGVHMRALHVPPGRQIADAAPAAMGRLLEDNDLTGWAGRGSTGRVYLAVLARPAPLSVEASPLIHYYRTGGATRRWMPVSARDGAAVVDLGARSDQIVAVRAASAETRTYPLVLDVQSDPRNDGTAAPGSPGALARRRAARPRVPRAGAAGRGRRAASRARVSLRSDHSPPACDLER